MDGILQRGLPLRLFISQVDHLLEEFLGFVQQHPTQIALELSGLRQSRYGPVLDRMEIIPEKLMDGFLDHNEGLLDIDELTREVGGLEEEPFVELHLGEEGSVEVIQHVADLSLVFLDLEAGIVEFCEILYQVDDDGFHGLGVEGLHSHVLQGVAR